MSAYDDDTATKGIAAQTITVITDIEKNPVTVDNNVAHLDGLLFEIASFVSRTGKWEALIEQGISLRGSKIIIDSAAAVPFATKTYSGARTYTVEDPCPPTTKRLADYNVELSAASRPVREALTKLPDGDTSHTVNPYLIKEDDLALGNAIAACFEDAVPAESSAAPGRTVTTQTAE